MRAAKALRRAQQAERDRDDANMRADAADATAARLSEQLMAVTGCLSFEEYGSIVPRKGSHGQG